MWATCLGNHSIVSKITTPYAHAQNRLAEQANHTIIKDVRCMLAESSLPKELWAEVAATQEIYFHQLGILAQYQMRHEQAVGNVWTTYNHGGV